MTLVRNHIITIILPLLFAGCSPRVATSFWRIGTPADSTRAGYAVLCEGKKVRHCYPITEYTATPEEETYRAFHHHGVAVESELMAYRIYFDKKQTIDPYCKRGSQLELTESYWYPNDSLLALGYGDDILRVSGTVGVGSVKYWDGKLRHFDKVASRSQRIVRQTRSSATIEVSDRGLALPGASNQPVDLTVQYTLKAGHRDMRCDVYCTAPLTDSLSGLCTGVQTIPAKGANHTSDIIRLELSNGVLLASFGEDWPVNDSAKYAKETVGLAVFIPYPYAGSLVQDQSNNLCLLNTLPVKKGTGVGCHFYLTAVGATKENHPVATSAEEWFVYLRRWAKRLK